MVVSRVTKRENLKLGVLVALRLLVDHIVGHLVLREKMQKDSDKIQRDEPKL